MKSLIITSILYLGVMLIYGCSSVSSGQAPTISDIRLNHNDTLMYKTRVFRYNKNNDPTSTDTIFTTKRVCISGHFSDEKQLSSYYVYLIPTSKPSTRNDTVYSFNKPGSDIFGKKDIKVDTFKIDSVPKYLSDKRLLTGKHYILKIKCTNKSGKEASIEKQVCLLYR